MTDNSFSRLMCDKKAGVAAAGARSCQKIGGFVSEVKSDGQPNFTVAAAGLELFNGIHTDLRFEPLSLVPLGSKADKKTWTPFDHQ